MSNYIVIECPHCNGLVQILVNEFNCKIFRHGYYKKTFKQIDPHLKKSECDNLVHNNLIYGCGKPSSLIKKETDYILEICDYI
jgi:hypothetical protein